MTLEIFYATQFRVENNLWAGREFCVWLFLYVDEVFEYEARGKKFWIEFLKRKVNFIILTLN